MVSPPSGSQRRRSPSSPFLSQSSDRLNDGISPMRSQSSAFSRLADYRRLNSLSLSDQVFNLVSDGWRQSTSSRYDAIWKKFRGFLRSRGISLDSVNLEIVLSYLHFLYDKGLAYRTICLHQSVLSMTLPKVDGFPVGEHNLVKRLIKGVFRHRPPSRRLFPSWDVAKVFEVFTSFQPPLGFDQLQRKTAFLLAMASARRPSELASLKCSPSFMIISALNVRFLPSDLSKTDRENHLGLPIVVSRLPAENSLLCPVSLLEALLLLRNGLNISHDYVFSQFHPPYHRLLAQGFAGRISWALRRAEIFAPPSSTRSVSVSDAYARGVNIDAILQAGDWSGVQTFFRHYLRPSACSFQQ